MSDLWEKYPDLMEAYEKMPRKTDFRQEFEAGWREAGWGMALSLATAAKDNAVAEAGAAEKEMESLLGSLREPFAKEPGAARRALKRLPAAFTRRAGGSCRNCGSKLSAAAFYTNCGAKLR